MNPVWLSCCFLVQGLLLQRQSAWPQAFGLWALLSVIYFLFAWSRLRWNQHLDMLLIMLGPASMAMLGAMQFWMPNCPLRQNPVMALQHFWIMSAAMLAVSLPLCWRYARCVQRAKVEHRAPYVFALCLLALDSIGMLLGMAAAHYTTLLLPRNTPGSPWLEHAAMLTAMTCGMLPAALVSRRLPGNVHLFANRIHVES